MFASFDKNPAMTLRVIKETKRYGRTHGQRENSIPPTNKVCRRYNKEKSFSNTMNTTKLLFTMKPKDPQWNFSAIVHQDKRMVSDAFAANFSIHT